MRFIPSNILNAFRNTKKENIENIKLNLFNRIGLSKNENLISLSIKLLSKFKNRKIIIVKIRNFKLALRLYLSSKNPKENN